MIDFDFPHNTVAVFDLDGTITRRDTYAGILLQELRKRPANVAKLVPLSVPVLRFALGRLDNAALKTAFLRSFFSGKSESALRASALGFVEQLSVDGFRDMALDTLSRHRKSGHQTILLSASLDFYVEEIARRLHFDHCICTRTVRRSDQSLTGELGSPNCRGEEKLARLESHLGDTRLQYYLVGYGDRETDFHLLTALDRGIVVNPGKRARARALDAGLQVVDW